MGPSLGSRLVFALPVRQTRPDEGAYLIAESAKQSVNKPSCFAFVPQGGARHCEGRSDAAIHLGFAWGSGLLRFARNDGGA
jgi:hypothetical protein